VPLVGDAVMYVVGCCYVLSISLLLPAIYRATQLNVTLGKD
jgi:hypothetical protein